MNRGVLFGEIEQYEKISAYICYWNINSLIFLHTVYEYITDCRETRRRREKKSKNYMFISNGF